MEELLREVKRGPRRIQEVGPEGQDAWLRPPPQQDGDAVDEAEVEAEAAWRDAQEAQQHKAKAPRYPERLAVLVREYTQGVEQGAWAQARTSLGQVSTEEEGGTAGIHALEDMATALLASLRKRSGWGVHVDKARQRVVLQGQGGASVSPEVLGEQILTPLREAARRTMKGAAAVGGLQQEGGALVLALVMEEEANEERCRAALDLVARMPCLLALHCCALGLASRDDLTSPLALDCGVAALSLLEPTWQLDACLAELTSRPSPSGGLQGWKSKPELLLPAELQGHDLTIRPLVGEDDGEAMEVARGMWARFREAITAQPPARSSAEKKNARRRGAPPKDNDEEEEETSLVVHLLARVRQAWAAARAAHRQQAAAPRLGRAALALVRTGLAVGEVDALVLGHLLPLCFALMEEYEREEAQVLGYVTWCLAAHKTTPAALACHAPIQMQVLQRCLKVVGRKPAMLRLLFFCLTELCRLSSSSAAQQWRGVVLEDLIAALARAAPGEQGVVFALLEGLHRLVPLFGEGYLLVRYYRPLTQVLTMAPLEEGEDAVRLVALRTLLLVLRQCDVMVHQHALETLAQVLRVYLLLSRRGDRRTATDRETMALCAEVATVLRTESKGREEALEAFVQGVVKEGGYEEELSVFWCS